MSPNNTLHKNRVYAPMLIALALILIVFALYPLYTDYLNTSIEIAQLEKTKSEKDHQIDEIKKIQTVFAGSGSNDMKAKIQKYGHTFDTSTIMESLMVNKYTKASPLTPAAIRIGPI